MHLIVDGLAHNVKLMINERLMENWLNKTVKIANMTPFGEPYIQGFPWPGSEDWTAITAFQPLMESALSVHCWPERKFVFIDLFSCNEFDDERVMRHIIRTFKMNKPTIIMLNRGINSKTGEITPANLRGVCYGEK